MLIPRIKRADPDKVFIICKNDEAATTMVDGDVVKYTVAASKNYGVDVILGTAVVVNAGVVSGRDVKVGDYGLIQVYGYHSNVKGTGTLATSATCIPGSANNITDGAAGDDPSLRMGIVLKALASGRVGVFLKCM